MNSKPHPNRTRRVVVENVAAEMGRRRITQKQLAATRAYRATHDIDAVRVLLGHSSVATTQVYVEVADDDLALAARGAWALAASA